jgi:non-homologous end joining protein Ku
VEYNDVWRGRSGAAIQKEGEGQGISVADTAPAGEGKVIDLMEALRASLEKSESARAQVNRLGPRKGPKRAEEPAKVARKANKRNA